MIETLRGLQVGNLRSRPQDNDHATLAPILKKNDARIDFHRSADDIYNRLRGFQPWPGAFTTFRGKNLNVWKGKPVRREIAQGEILVEGDDLLAGCGKKTSLAITELQLEGKRRMSAHDFIQGYRPLNGEHLGG
jgi:methionyl-tRNA formyltransferase